jgi:hypothetical protein
MLQRIGGSFQQQVISMLKWLCFSSRVLSVEELAEIFILRSQEAIDLDKLKPERLFNARDVLKYLGSFIVVSDDRCRSTVLLAHISVKEYLTSQHISQGPAAAFSLTEVNVRFHIARSCLVYLVDVACTEIPGGYASQRNRLSRNVPVGVLAC